MKIISERKRKEKMCVCVGGGGGGDKKGVPKAESNRIPSAYQPNALPLGKTGSPDN